MLPKDNELGQSLFNLCTMTSVAMVSGPVITHHQDEEIIMAATETSSTDVGFTL